MFGTIARMRVKKGGKPRQAARSMVPRESCTGAGGCARPLTSRHLSRPSEGRRPCSREASGRPGRPHDVSERQPLPAVGHTNS